MGPKHFRRPGQSLLHGHGPEEHPSNKRPAGDRKESGARLQVRLAPRLLPSRDGVAAFTASCTASLT